MPRGGVRVLGRLRRLGAVAAGRANRKRMFVALITYINHRVSPRFLGPWFVCFFCPDFRLRYPKPGKLRSILSYFTA